MDRRAWLGLCLGAWTGCLGSSRAPQTELAWIRLTNNREEARDVEVVIERDGRAVFRARYRLGTRPGHATTTVDDPVDGPGRYSLSVDVGDQVAHLRPSDVSDVERRDRCVGITFTLHDRGTVGFESEPAREC